MLWMSYQYFQKPHVNKDMYKVCSGRQPTVSHGLKIQKYKMKGSNEDTDAKEKQPVRRSKVWTN